MLPLQGPHPSPPCLHVLAGLVAMQGIPVGEDPLPHFPHTGQMCLSFASVVQPTTDGKYSGKTKKQNPTTGVPSTRGLIVPAVCRASTLSPRDESLQRMSVGRFCTNPCCLFCMRDLLLGGSCSQAVAWKGGPLQVLRGDCIKILEMASQQMNRRHSTAVTQLIEMCVESDFNTQGASDLNGDVS